MDVSGLEIQSTNLADQIKDLRKVRLQRQVMENPELARELVKVEATGTYNAKGDVIQAVSADLGDA
jgi:mRNA-degrading endonuclease toxin of MazEF toxin-antitoxin module